MADDAAKPAGAERSDRPAGLLRQTPYLLLIVPGLIGVGWTNLSGTPPTIYWVLLRPIAVLICIAADGSRDQSNVEHFRLLASQLLHWAALVFLNWWLWGGRGSGRPEASPQ